MSDRRGNFPVVLLQLALAVYFLTLGVIGILTYNSPGSELARAVTNFFQTGNSGVVDLVIAIVQVLSGLVVLASLFVRVSRSGLYFAIIVVLVIWLVQIAYYRVVVGLLEPAFWTWLNVLSRELVIAAGLWVVARDYS